MVRFSAASDSPVETRAISSSDEAAFSGLARVYQESLPESERKSLPALRAMLQRPEYIFLIALDGPTVTGFTISVQLDPDATLLEYMAVDPAYRCRGIGHALVRRLASEHLGDRFLLIEVETDNLSSLESNDAARRKAFYRRLGCKEIMGLHYRMPQVSADEPPPMDMLVYHRNLPDVIEKPRLHRWLQSCYTQVYDRHRDDPAIHAMLDGLPSLIPLR